MTGSLCESCIHKRDVISARGSRFLLCRLSTDRPEFPKYPPQPVRSCRGFEVPIIVIQPDQN